MLERVAPIKKERIMETPPPSWYDVKMRAMHPRVFAAYVTMLSCPVFFVCRPSHCVANRRCKSYAVVLPPLETSAVKCVHSHMQ